MHQLHYILDSNIMHENAAIKTAGENEGVPLHLLSYFPF